MNKIKIMNGLMMTVALSVLSGVLVHVGYHELIAENLHREAR